MKRILATLTLGALLSILAPSALAADRRHIEATAARFELPVALIDAVIAAESAGDPRAVSPAGAQGLMQLMPATWAQLRARLGLGADPFDPHDNVTAGAAYLRQLLDRYGAPGFLAAYNAGPGRYKQSLAGRALPAETQAYVQRLTRLGLPLAPSIDWRSAGLFTTPWPRDLGRTGPDQAQPRATRLAPLVGGDEPADR